MVSTPAASAIPDANVSAAKAAAAKSFTCRFMVLHPSLRVVEQ
jgi:hypothetical protein